ncbi:MAG: 3-dehydro-L-gulonate 2-dehydrogenase [Anaerolineae bacterium]|nr:3-dehydro-L-gulonate 2-dehydrogenase [Anaerolineae bacterium]
MRVTYDEMLEEFVRILRAVGFTPERAELLAQIFAENSRDGIASHGYNRILFFANSVKRGDVNIEAEPRPVARFGAWEQWDGQLGAGIINALACTDRAMELAREHGIGCVALQNTNHWLRPGKYGWRAAEAGFAFICWTNTIPNVPPWGGTEPRVGNNPIVLAIPCESGPVVLDIAMSQFAFGQLELYRLRDQELPVPGGYDAQGQLTTNAAAILESARALPIGYWKGSGLALMLDLFASLMSGGSSTYQLGQQTHEYGVSQVYWAVDISRAGTPAVLNRVITDTLDSLKTAPLADDNDAIRYPGERILKTRADYLAHGIPVDRAIWQAIREF